MATITPEHLGQPDINVAGLQIWIHGRQFPDSEDYWDRNWLRVTAHCGGDGSSVWVTGSIIHVPELARLKDGLEKFINIEQGRVALDTMEPNLKVEFEARTETSKVYGNQIMMMVNITPNLLFQHHQFVFEISKIQIQGCLSQLQVILGKYPSLGEPAP